jgi:RimJ/RimL family protein N-acetyltransferase
MTALHVPGIHLNTTTENEAALRLYEKTGFRVLARRRNSVWVPWLPEKPVENLLYGKLLSDRT